MGSTDRGLKDRRKRFARVLLRDASFLIFVAIVLNIVDFVERNAFTPSTVELNGAPAITDNAFTMTEGLHVFLKQNPIVNDVLAFFNSLLFLFSFLWTFRATMWLGDYTLVSRILMTQLFRSFCGWFTHLPPSPEFLMSVYDFPEIMHCFGYQCTTDMAMPFVSFFSGHVATVVITANHLYQNGHVRWSVFFHALNLLQIVRLLATRGHYSIDLIIGWAVAVYVVVPADRLARWYTHDRPIAFPKTSLHAFESFIGTERPKESVETRETAAQLAVGLLQDELRRNDSSESLKAFQTKPLTSRELS